MGNVNKLVVNTDATQALATSLKPNDTVCAVAALPESDDMVVVMEGGEGSGTLRGSSSSAFAVRRTLGAEASDHGGYLGATISSPSCAVALSDDAIVVGGGKISPPSFAIKGFVRYEGSGPSRIEKGFILEDGPVQPLMAHVLPDGRFVGLLRYRPGATLRGSGIVLCNEHRVTRNQPIGPFLTAATVHGEYVWGAYKNNDVTAFGAWSLHQDAKKPFERGKDYDNVRIVEAPNDSELLRTEGWVSSMAAGENTLFAGTLDGQVWALPIEALTDNGEPQLGTPALVYDHVRSKISGWEEGTKKPAVTALAVVPGGKEVLVAFGDGSVVLLDPAASSSSSTVQGVLPPDTLGSQRSMRIDTAPLTGYSFTFVGTTPEEGRFVAISPRVDKDRKEPNFFIGQVIR